MKSNVLIPTLLATACGLAWAEGGPQATGQFRIVKPDGSTVIQQAAVSTDGTPNTMNVNTTDAFVAMNGKCAFNVKYDEISASAATGTVNRIYSNDTLIAQNSAIDLQPGTVRTVWTQPYLSAGQNNVKLVVDANGASPSTAWVRVNVAGTCGAAPAPAPAPKEDKKTTTPPPPPPPPAPAPVVKYGPGSTQWNALYNAWGYSNYATTQLKTKGYARYSDLARLNADLTAAVGAKTVDKGAYESLMARWTAFLNDAAFRAAMAAVTPGTGK